MTRSKRFRGDEGGFPGTAAHVAAAAFVVITMFAALWAGPAAAASGHHAQSRAAASPSPASVKFYIVPQSGSRQREFLSEIAEKTLGDASRFMEIFELNKGRLQPNGGRLENPASIEPGWILQLPPDAAGPGVHFGPLPVVTPSASSSASSSASLSASPRPSRPGVSEAAAPHRDTSRAIVLGSASVVLIAAAGLAIALSRRRRAGANLRRRPAHARTSGHRSGHGPASLPARKPPPALPAGDRKRIASPPPAPQSRVQPGNWGSLPTPAADAFDIARRRSASPVQTAYAAAQTYAAQTYDVALRDDPSHTISAEVRNAASARLARRILSDAEEQALAIREVAQLEAAELRQEMSDQVAAMREVAQREAAELRRRASDQVIAMREVAQREAAELRQEVSDQATVMREDAEREVAELRAAVMTTSAELERVTAYFTKNLTGPARPATSLAKPATSVAKPASKSGGRPRQYVAMRLTVLATASLVLFAVIAGSTEVALHGYAFFVFRSAGTGATSGNGLQENQGPGQPDAPGAHHHPQAALHHPQAALHHARKAHHHLSGQKPSTSSGGSHG